MGCENLIMKKLYDILKIIKETNHTKAINLRSIDMRVMMKCPEVVYHKELLIIINHLLEKSYIEWVRENSSVIITKKGIEYLDGFEKNE